MISDALVAVARCPDCGAAIARTDGRVACTGCGRTFDATRGYLDLRPSEQFAEQTKYLDEALHADARHESVGPPLLGSKIRNDMLRKFLALAPGDRVVDLGCGSGRTLAWNASSGAALTGVDISPFFAKEALASSDLLLGDLRRLPLASGAFTKAWSLDVLEHLSPEALRGMLEEANRVLADRGEIFVYTHVRKNGPLAVGVRAVNGLARFCERVGLLDLKQERLRKSDHLNPLLDHDDLARTAADCGFTIERITYYTPIVGAFVENVLVRITERWMTRRASTRLGAAASADPSAAVRSARASAKSQVSARGLTYHAVNAASALMKIDVILFGRFRSGPFFATLRKVGPPKAART